MRHIRRIALWSLWLAVSVVSPAWSQVTADEATGEPGVRESARLLDRPTLALSRLRTARVAGQPAERDKWRAIPGFVWAEGLNLQAFSAAYITSKTPRPLQVRGAVKRLDFGDVTKTQLSADAKALVIDTSEANDATPSRLSLLAEVRRTLDTSRQFKVGAAFEHSIKAVTFGANVEYLNAKKDNADSVDALVPTLGVTYAWANSLETSFDYSFDNDVAGEDDYSFTVAHPIHTGRLGSTVLVFGAGKHRTVFATVIVPIR